MKGIVKVIVPLFVLDAVLLTLSGVYDNATHGVTWVLGGVGWFGFMLTTLVLIVLAAVALVRTAMRRRATA